MSPSESTFIHPHPLSAQYRWIPSAVWSFRDRIDEGRLRNALRLVTRQWPCVVGKLVTDDNTTSSQSSKSEQPMIIQLPPNPDEVEISLDVQTIDRSTPFPNTLSQQDSLVPYSNVIGQIMQPDKDMPLLQVRLTHLGSTGGSVIGISWAHILGDAKAYCEFMKLVSALYVDEGYQLPHPPVFEMDYPVPTSKSSPEVVKSYDCTMLTPVSLQEFMESFATLAPTRVVVSVLSLEQQSELKRVFERLRPGTDKSHCQADVSAPPLSTQDCVAGWQVSILERIYGRSINVVQYVVDFRDLLDLESFESNAIEPLRVDTGVSSVPGYQPAVFSFLADSETSFKRAAFIAHSIRARLTEIRSDPKELRNWLDLCVERKIHTVQNGGLLQLVMPPDEVYVNSYGKIDMRSVDFGMARAKVGFHTAMTLARTLHTIGANDGESLEVGFHIEANQAQQAKALAVNDEQWWSHTMSA